MHDIFYFTDLHGHLDLFHMMRDWCYKQDPECTIIFGGDAADRGEFGYQIIKELLDDPHVIYVYGNHEDLFIKAVDELIGYYAQSDELYNRLHSCKDEEDVENIIVVDDCNFFDVSLHLQNGGFPTLRDWLLDGADEDIIDRLRVLPRTFTHENIDFCHAGSMYKYFKEANDAEYQNIMITYMAEERLIWDRNLLPCGWEDNRICVHGHTPTPFLPDGIIGGKMLETNAHPVMWYDKMGAKQKRGGAKIDMDTGAIFTNRGYVLNVRTLIATGFRIVDEFKQPEFENYKFF